MVYVMFVSEPLLQLMIIMLSFCVYLLARCLFGILFADISVGIDRSRPRLPSTMKIRFGEQYFQTRGGPLENYRNSRDFLIVLNIVVKRLVF